MLTFDGDGETDADAAFRKALADPQFGLEGYKHAIVMPAADRSLLFIFQSERPDLSTTRALVREVVEAVDHLHSRGLVHGDIKVLRACRRGRASFPNLFSPSQALNILRIGGRLKITDFDSSKPISTTNRPSILGDKFSSGVLGPEMFYMLRNKEELRMFEEYWREDKDADTPLWRKIAPKGGFVVRTFRVVQETGAPDLSRRLPYDLITSSVAMDLWSLGALMYLLITGEALVPSNRDDDCVNAEAMAMLCCWDDKTARERLGKVEDIGARHLLSHLPLTSTALQPARC